jgi:hypothetical protein
MFITNCTTHGHRQAIRFAGTLGRQLIHATEDPNPAVLITMLDMLRRTAPQEASKHLQAIHAGREPRLNPRDWPARSSAGEDPPDEPEDAKEKAPAKV